MARKGLVFAMEEEIVGSVDESVLETTAEVSEGSMEVSDAANETEQLITAVEEAVEDASTVERIQEVAEASVEEGEGLSEQAAEITEVAIESIHARLGISKRVMPSMESFGSSNSRVAATRIAVEGFKETVVRIWKAIVDGVKSIIQKIKDFFMKFFDNSAKVKKLAESLKTKVNEIKAKKASTTDIKEPGIAEVFNDSKTGQFQLIKILENQKILTVGSTSVVDALSSSVGLIEGLIKKDVKEDDVLSLSKTMEKLLDNIKKSFAGTTSNTRQEGDLIVDEVDFGPLINGNIISTELKINKAADEFVSFSYTFSPATGDKNKKPAKESLPVLSAKEQEDVCSAVIQLMDETEKFKKNKDHVINIGTKVIKTVDAVLKLVDAVADTNKDNANIKKIISNARGALVACMNVSGRIFTMTPAYNVKAGNAALKYVAKSQAEYK